MLTLALVVMLSQTADDVKKETGEAVDATKKYAEVLAPENSLLLEIIKDG